MLVEGRGYDPVKKCWRYGVVLKERQEVFVSENYKHVRVIKESMGYFTGFTDLNGNRVFEGDVIRCLLDWRLEEICFGRHEAYDGSGRQETDFYAVNSGEMLSFTGVTLPGKVLAGEVIGNVYQCPELRQSGGLSSERAGR